MEDVCPLDISRWYAVGRPRNNYRRRIDQQGPVLLTSGALLAVALAKACIRAKSKRKIKHAIWNFLGIGRMASANVVDKRMTASGVAMGLATTAADSFVAWPRFVRIR